MELERRYSKVFWMIYHSALQKPRCISHRGGTRSGKTFSTLQFLNELIPQADRSGEITSVCSESLPHLKRGAIRDFEAIIGHTLKDDPNWNATDLVYTYPNGAKLEFFSVDSSAKVLGPARKRLFLNECNHISWETARQLFVRTTGLLLLDYNPSSSFWAIENVEPRDNTICLKTTYLDNIEFLSVQQVQEIEAQKNADPMWWKVYGLGEVGSLEGLIYDFETIDKLPEKGSMTEVYGLDFGYVNDPTALVHILADHRTKTFHVEELCYRKGMLNKDIVDAFKDCTVPKNSIEIFADSAEQKSIAELAMYGYNVKPCYKGKAVTEQIAYVKGWKMKVTKSSLNLIKELRNYSWLKDKDGKPLNTPQDLWNHCADAMRYALFTKFGEFKRPSHGGIAKTTNAW